MWEIIVRAGLKYISRAVGVLDDLEFVYGLRRSREIVAFARKPVDASLDVDGLDRSAANRPVVAEQYAALGKHCCRPDFPGIGPVHIEICFDAVSNVERNGP